MKKTLLSVVCVLLFAVMCFSAWKLWSALNAYHVGTAAYDTLHDAAREDGAGRRQLNIDFVALREINPDAVAWIYVPGTEIDYPVVQGADDRWYLSHLFTGEENGAGCIFLDSRNRSDYSDRNNVLYGHHMKNGSMFAGLDAYKDPAFYAAHPTGILETPEGEYTIHFFSGYVADIGGDAWNTAFDDAGYQAWLAGVAEKSCFVAETLPTAEDRVLTLSTCSYEFDDARFVLHGFLTLCA